MALAAVNETVIYVKIWMYCVMRDRLIKRSKKTIEVRTTPLSITPLSNKDFDRIHVSIVSKTIFSEEFFPHCSVLDNYLQKQLIDKVTILHLIPYVAIIYSYLILD